MVLIEPSARTPLAPGGRFAVHGFEVDSGSTQSQSEAGCA